MPREHTQPSVQRIPGGSKGVFFAASGFNAGAEELILRGPRPEVAPINGSMFLPSD